MMMPRIPSRADGDRRRLSAYDEFYTDAPHGRGYPLVVRMTLVSYCPFLAARSPSSSASRSQTNAPLFVAPYQRVPGK